MQLDSFGLIDDGISPLLLDDLADAVPCVASLCLRIDNLFDISFQVGVALLGLPSPGPTIAEHDLDLLNGLAASLKRSISNIDLKLTLNKRGLTSGYVSQNWTTPHKQRYPKTMNSPHLIWRSAE